MTFAACTGHSFSITRSIPEGDSEDVEVLTTMSDTYRRLGCIVHGTDVHHSQSVLQDMVRFCVDINLGPLKRGGLYGYLDLQVALQKNIKELFSRTAQVVLI